MKNGIVVAKHNQLILNDFITVSLLHENLFVKEKTRKKSARRKISPHEAESRVFSFTDSHQFLRRIMKQNQLKTKSLLKFHGFIKDDQMKHEAGMHTKMKAGVPKSEEFK